MSVQRQRGVRVPYLDTLVPAVADPGDLLERLRRRRLTDATVSVDPGPLDEATLNLIRYVLAETRQDLVLELPQVSHEGRYGEFRTSGPLNP